MSVSNNKEGTGKSADSMCCTPCSPCHLSKEELKKALTPLQYQITQEKGTERAFTGKYYKLKDDGIYSCVVCGEELFSSQTKYESGSGWPAFYDVVDPKKVRLKQDFSHVGGNILLIAMKPGLVRTEVSCARCQSHLGHLFDDGPKPSGKRYCINSAALGFRPLPGMKNADQLEKRDASSTTVTTTAQAAAEPQKQHCNGNLRCTQV